MFSIISLILAIACSFMFYYSCTSFNAGAILGTEFDKTAKSLIGRKNLGSFDNVTGRFVYYKSFNQAKVNCLDDTHTDIPFSDIEALRIPINDSENIHQNSTETIISKIKQDVSNKTMSESINTSSTKSTSSNAVVNVVEQSNESVTKQNLSNVDLTSVSIDNNDVFSYTGLNRLVGDTDEEWNERSFALDSFYHQYINPSNKYNISSTIGTYIVDGKDIDKKKFVFITGSSTNHFGVNICMILNLINFDLHSTIVFLNMGLSAGEVQLLLNLFGVIEKVRGVDSPGRFYYREINYEQNPEFLRAATYGPIYALKAITTVNIAEECQCMVFWMDAGNGIGPYFTKLYKSVAKYGVQTAQSQGPIQKLTNPKMIEWYQDKLPKVPITDRMCSGGFMGLDYNNAYAWKNVALMHRECCLRQRCIIPEGSAKWSHRFDQSSLSILVHAYDLSNACGFITPGIVRFHMDVTVDRAGFLPFYTNIAKDIERKYKIQNATNTLLSIL